MFATHSRSYPLCALTLSSFTCRERQLGLLTNLRVLYVGSNSVSGTLPPSVGNLTNLIQLTCKEARLSGTLPSQLGQLSSLANLQLHANIFSGACSPPRSHIHTCACMFYMSDGRTSLAAGACHLAPR
jgi:hypothetical protein